MDRKEAEARAIIIIRAGSHLVGLNHPDSDLDTMGICIEPPDELFGIGKPFDQYVSTEPDVSIYGLRKYIGLALSGNPTIIQLLFAKEEAIIKQTGLGSDLQALAPDIVSRRAGKAFLGYLEAQRLRMLGLRGNAGHGSMRNELVDKYGYDTKYAMHMLRLGMQGVELLTSGKLTLPMLQEDRDYLLGVRHGTQTAQDCIRKAEELEAEIKSLMATSPLPAHPNTTKVATWMLKTYLRSWPCEHD